MQRLSGLLLMLAGASLGVYTYLPKPQDGAEKLAEVTRISAAPDRDARTSLAGSSSAAANRNADAKAGTVGAAPAGTLAAAVPPAANVATANKAPGTWSTVVTAETANTPKLSSSKPADDETRAELTRDLQKELARVGCYGGEITGAWTPSTKRAMSAFMDRVNASLPVNEPDYILLTLVQGHAAAACGVDCPAGQALNGDGRCVPQAVIAQAQKKSQREEQRRVAEVRKAETQDRLARTSAERQRLAADKAAKTSKQTVASAGPEVLPWLQEDAAAPAQGLKIVTRPREPLPGMMSIGGPESTHPQNPSGSVANVSPSAVAPVIAPKSSSRVALAEPGEDADTSSAAPELKAPKPVPAERPQIMPDQRGMPGTKSGAAVRPGLPGTKSGAAIRQGLPGTKSGAATRPRSISKSQLQPRKVTAVRRPAPHLPPVAFKPPRPKANYYAMNTGKVRRGQPRPGTMRFNVMQSLGGIY